MRKAIIKRSTMLRGNLGSLGGLQKLFIAQFTKKSQGQVNPAGIHPTKSGQLRGYLANCLAQVALQSFIEFKSDKGTCHAANNISSNSLPSMVSTSIRCSEMAISLSLRSRRILSAVA